MNSPINNVPPSSVLRPLTTVPKLFLLAAFLLRLFFLTGPIDNPAWRQTETAYMTWAMYQESPPEFFHSKVPYRGPKDVHLAELPIQPLITAYLYKALGRESLPAARIVTLLFFLGATALLGLIVRKWFGDTVAWYTMAVFAWMPLGLMYSRAVHVDFCIIFFSHLFLWLGMKFFDTGRWGYYAGAVLAATAAFAMKAPYCFYFGLPLAAWALKTRSDWNVRNILALGFVFVVPLVAAWGYNEHRMALEAGETESLLYPMKWTPEFTREWFFGTPAMRLNMDRWGLVIRRAVYQVFTPAGAILALIGTVASFSSRFRRGRLAMWGLLAGIGLFMLVVFPHFSSAHDYYSLPLLAPGAILVALALVAVGDVIGRKIYYARVIVMALCLTGVAYGCYAGVQRVGYLRRDWQKLQTGAIIDEHTSPETLVLSVTKGRSTGWSDPVILYHAHRRGWAIELESLTPGALALYQSGGAEVAALLMTPVYPPAKEEFGVLAEHPHVIHPISDPDGNPIGHVVIFDLRTADSEPITNND